MTKTRLPLSRRQFLATGAAAGIGVVAAEAEQLRPFTPFIELGPFYPVEKPLDRDADLTLISGRSERAKGQIIHVIGRVVTRSGDPVANAAVELWQANSFGRYNHPADPNPAAIDPNFQGYGIQTTDSDGRFRFKTIKPASYPAGPDWMRAPHLHFDIMGKTDRMVSQLFFKDDPLNDQDRVLRAIRSNQEGLFLRQHPQMPDVEADAIALSIDFVMFRH